MWPDRRLVELFEIEHPIVLAPMAGFGTVELAAAVADANRLACEIGFLAEAIPDFPLPLGEPEPLRAAAEQKGCRDLTPLWSGQAAALSREMPAAILMQITVKETLERLHRLRCN